MKDGIKRLSAIELSAFCTQIELILSAGISLDEGIYLMAEDAGRELERRILKALAQETESGVLLYHGMEKIGGFSEYLINMTRIGEESGSLEQIMKLMAAYYKKEDRMSKIIKDAVTYPVVMIFMMLVILFILMRKVIPVFENVFIQLGTELPLTVKSAISFGGAFSGIFVTLLVVFVLLSVILTLLARENVKISIVEKGKEAFFRRSKVFTSLGISRFCNVVSIMLKSGMDVRSVLILSKTVAGNQYIEEKVDICQEVYEETSNFVEALRETNFFMGFNRQMLIVGEKTGRLDEVLEELSERYGEEAEHKIRKALAKFEPSIVAVLSAVVGLILLAVMLPLIGMMLAMG